MKDRKNSSLLGHRLKFRWLFLFSLFAGPLPLSFGGQSAVAANNIIQQQKISVTGKVVDNLGEPIIGANVVVQGQTVGTITDIDGVFKLDVPKGAKLLISFIGYSSKTVEVKQSNIEIVLDDDSQMLGEVEVVAYGVQKKVSVTGAISSVKGEELTKTPTGSISNMLSGQMAGLTTVQYSGEPGSDAANIFVRGQATWNQSAPLIQVDGVERSMNDISENGKLVFGKYESYEKVYSLVFRHIGKVTDLAGINRKVSYYSARKTFAQHGYDIGIEIEKIEYCIGHSMKNNRPIFNYIRIMQEHADKVFREIFDQLLK
jgi:hypothetical protein